MKRLALLALVPLLSATASAQVTLPENVKARSVSGQFIIYVMPRTVLPSRVGVDTNHISLQPTLIAVSCERIKQALGARLGLTGSFRTRIHLELAAARSPDDQVTMVNERFRDGWSYRLRVPDVMERGNFVRTIIRVLLLDVANRNAGARLAEIPEWLTDGLAQEFLSASELAILLPPPDVKENGILVTRLSVNERKSKPMQKVWETLRRRSLTFEELSWPNDDQLAGEAGVFYRANAHLFVSQLLRLRSGQACMRQFLFELPRHLNWQVAFLTAFQSHFQGPLDVEKWWALQVARFTGRDPDQVLPLADTWQKLDDIIRSPAEVRTDPDELPLRAEVTLQMIVREWGGLQQAQVLRRKHMELGALGAQATPDLLPLVEEYRVVLNTYLQRLGALAPNFNGRKVNRISPRILAETIRQLDAVDTKCKALRAAPASAPVATAQPAPPRR